MDGQVAVRDSVSASMARCIPYALPALFVGLALVWTGIALWPHSFQVGDPKRPNASAEPFPVLAFHPVSEPVQFTERPLFRASRRPPKVQEPNEGLADIEAIEKTQPEPEQVLTLNHSLTAVVITEEEAAVYLMSPHQSELIHLTYGDTVDGWTLSEIQPDAALFRHSAQQIRLELRPTLDSEKHE